MNESVGILGMETCGGVTGTVRLSRPAGYSFRAGQYFTLTLETPEGSVKKAFSHADAPGDPETMMTTRPSASAFKRTLFGLGPGDEVAFEGPFGKLPLDDAVGGVVFLSGGVGITPVRSLLRDARDRDLRRTSWLFYGNREDVCVPYRDELRALARDDGRVRLVEAFEHPPEGWEGAVGFITADLVRAHLDPGDGWHFVVAGPPAMVVAMEIVLDALEVPVERRHVERFAGY